jgi:hypothetical protein
VALFLIDPWVLMIRERRDAFESNPTSAELRLLDGAHCGSE